MAIIGYPYPENHGEPVGALNTVVLPNARSERALTVVLRKAETETKQR